MIHADNCGGQNKNRFCLIGFVSFLTLSGLFDEVSLFFLIVGHTKNVCDGSFGNVKTFPVPAMCTHLKPMMTILKDCAANSMSVFASQVKWQDLERNFGKAFQISSSCENNSTTRLYF